MKAKDEYNASIEKSFNMTVKLTNVIENSAPVNLELSNNTIQENQPIGAIVGQLSASDPDGDVLTSPWLMMMQKLFCKQAE